MGLHELAEKESKSKASRRGAARNDKRLEAITRRRKSVSVDWLDCDAGRIQAVIHKITAIGGAVTFGTSRDGGASSLTLMLDGERETLWFNAESILDDELAAVAEVLDVMD